MDFSSTHKKVEELKSLCEFSQQDYAEILRHVTVTWLSLQSAIERLIKIWRPWKIYHLTQEGKNTHPLIWKSVNSQENEINEHLLSLAECFLYFVNSVLPISCKATKILKYKDTLSPDGFKIMLEVDTNRKCELDHVLDSIVNIL